jgi:cyclopropane-fatty-acyl-phospholipid synthase
MLMHLFNTALHAAEHGRLPDTVVRAGIRRLLRQRLQSLQAGTVEDWTVRHQQFVDDCRNSPIAVVPELANEQHYEVPAQYFHTVLGPRLKYSCCEWHESTKTLQQAEEAALATTCRRADLQNGQSILELGCGWGSLSLWMAEHYSECSVTAVSNSNSQREFIQQQAERNGFENLTVVTADMNDFRTEQRFDRVVSVEMFEHMRNHEELMRRISSWLNPEGRLFVHIFCHHRFAYLFESNDDRDWMARVFFSGGMMPAQNLLPSYQRDLQLDRQWCWDGRHYERTCNAWLKRQDDHQDEIRALFAEAYGSDQVELWLNRWRMFYMACAELFGFRDGREWFVGHYRFQKP